MLLRHAGGQAAAGKTDADTDMVEGRFLELHPEARLAQAVRFESADPDPAGEMRITCGLTEHSEGTEVVVTCAPPRQPQDEGMFRPAPKRIMPLDSARCSPISPGSWSDVTRHSVYVE